MDAADVAEEREELIRQKGIEHARTARYDLKGADDCLKCGEPNDRCHEGYATCTDCVEGAQ